MKIHVLGGGFGVYGYIPAALHASFEVSTQEKYLSIFQSRSELKNFIPQITFREDFPRDLDAVVVALNPERQARIIPELLQMNLRHIFLEKPLAPDEFSRKIVLNQLLERNQEFSIAYLFNYTQWFYKLQDALQQNNSVQILIEWELPIPSREWKNELDLGGGIVAYYGSHLLNLFLNLGIMNTYFSHSSGAFSLSGNYHSHDIIFNVRFSEIHKFSVLINSKVVLSNPSPFGEVGIEGSPDPRIPYLERYLIESLENRNLKKNLAIEDSIKGAISEIYSSLEDKNMKLSLKS